MLHLDEVLVKSSDVKRAMNISLPIVALESTVLTHGLPRPQNIQLAHDMERTVREQGATPATIAFLDGYLHIGLSEGDLDRLANEKAPTKSVRVISQR
jgi:pseudouridine-5'-phosphate glycosidase